MQELELRIIESIKNGDNDKALAYLYDKPLKNIRKYVLKNGGSPEDANDVFQDSVIALFQLIKQEKFNANYQLEGFLFIVAKNAWINKVKRNKKIMIIDQDNINANHTDDENQLKEIISAEKSTIMKQVFDQLDEKCKLLLGYVMYDRLSMKEISAKMGFSNENVAKTKHYRCKQYLARIIRDNKGYLNILKS